MAGMASAVLPVEADRSTELFLTAVDELAPGVVTGFYLTGSVALGDFHAAQAGAILFARQLQDGLFLGRAKAGKVHGAELVGSLPGVRRRRGTLREGEGDKG